MPGLFRLTLPSRYRGGPGVGTALSTTNLTPDICSSKMSHILLKLGRGTLHRHVVVARAD